MILNDWQAKAVNLFGPNPNRWEFVCPECGEIQSRQDFLLLGMPDDMIDSIVGYSCIRRWRDQACMFTGGGPVILEITPEEPKRPTFDFLEL